MPDDSWPSKRLAVASLHLDAKNPRLGRETRLAAPREIVQYLFEHDKAMDVAESIAQRGFFPSEPLLAVRESDRLVVLEGNRRLAALKALKEPGLLEGARFRKIERLSHRTDLGAISRVPVIIAPNRKAADQLLVGRHIGTPVRAWQAENRASFILDKLTEGYTDDQLREDLGFTGGQIQDARLTRAVADMARSLDLSDEVQAKLENPRASIFTTLKRVLEFSAGRQFLMIKPDPEHGIRGTTTKKEFVRGYARLVEDVALGKETSRSLNKNSDVQRYFGSWSSSDLPQKKQGSFVPSDITDTGSVTSRAKSKGTALPRKPKSASKTVIPKSFPVPAADSRITDILLELRKLKRDEYPNAGSVLLRVFFELTLIDYLQRTGDLEKLRKKLAKKNKLRHGRPEMKKLITVIKGVAKLHLAKPKASKVEKALSYEPSAPFSFYELNAFVHDVEDFPTGNDIKQFWSRTEPLFSLMLEDHADEPQQ